jgi:putative FmdB family regulatory protein
MYVYVCPACRVEVEERRAISQIDDPAACPICSGDCVRGITTFSLGGETAESIADRGGAFYTPKRGHRVGCPCCVPLDPNKADKIIVRKRSSA